MLSAEEPNQISQVMAEQLKPIKEEIQQINERLDEIAPDTEITRVASNELVKWVEVNFSYKYPFPMEQEEIV